MPPVCTEVVLPDLRLPGQRELIVRRCYANGSAAHASHLDDPCVLRYRATSYPPTWKPLRHEDLMRCSGDDFRALARLDLAACDLPVPERT